MNYRDMVKVPYEALEGRAVRKVVGKNSALDSKKMTFGMTHFSLQYGPMEPHHHAEELIYVLECEDAIVRYGETKECEKETISMFPGMLMQFEEMEWHVFEFTKDTGYAKILFLYGQVDNIRPDDLEETKHE